MVLRKGFRTFDEFYAQYCADEVDEHTALIHFRITTRGAENSSNCHPFAIEHGALIHNGTMSSLGEHGKGISDTAEFAARISTLTPDQITVMRPILESFMGTWNKVALLMHDGELLVFNERQWIQEDGVLYSNTGFREYTSPRGGHGSSQYGYRDGSGRFVAWNDGEYDDDALYEYWAQRHSGTRTPAAPAASAKPRVKLKAPRKGKSRRGAVDSGLSADTTTRSETYWRLKGGAQKVFDSLFYGCAAKHYEDGFLWGADLSLYVQLYAHTVRFYRERYFEDRALAIYFEKHEAMPAADRYGDMLKLCQITKLLLTNTIEDEQQCPTTNSTSVDTPLLTATPSA